ncbi:MAG: hypothetical protein ACE144_19755 [Thermodesulfobacteriota bacterium]
MIRETANPAGSLRFHQRRVIRQDILVLHGILPRLAGSNGATQRGQEEKDETQRKGGDNLQIRSARNRIKISRDRMAAKSEKRKGDASV